MISRLIFKRFTAQVQKKNIDVFESILQDSAKQSSAAVGSNYEKINESIREQKAKQENQQTMRQERLHTFRIGDLYSPEDLFMTQSDYSEQSKRNFMMNSFDKHALNGIDENGRDWMDRCGLKIEQEYKNVLLLSEFVNEIGQVLPRSKTMLSKENQKKLVKTINHAVCLGIIPRTSKHWAARRFVR